jgi:DNA-binding CsgD family transcriptional regulator
MISTNKRLGIDYYSLEFYRYGLFNKSPHTYDSGFHMWDHFACDPNKIYEHIRREHSLAHGLTIVQQHGAYCDFFMVATRPNNDQINNFYLNKKELFTQLMANLYESMAPTLQELESHKVSVPYRPEGDENFIITLSPRQQECAFLLAEGFTSKEIAKSLELSYRTVEEYINILKAKFEAKNRAHLLGMLKKIL